MRYPMNPTVAMPRMPRPMMTATMIRMILRALLPPLDGGGARGAVAVTPGADGPAGTAAPHLLQNFVPSFRVAPQELQNAISHLVDRDDTTRRASIPQIELETEALSVLGVRGNSRSLHSASYSLAE